MTGPQTSEIRNDRPAEAAAAHGDDDGGVTARDAAGPAGRMFGAERVVATRRERDPA